MDIYTQSYYPIEVAADMTGYSRRRIEKLIFLKRVRSRKAAGRRVVHLGSLLSHRSCAATHRRELTRLDSWLKTRSHNYLNNSSYPKLAADASAALGLTISPAAIYRAFKRLRILPKSRRHPHA